MNELLSADELIDQFQKCDLDHEIKAEIGQFLQGYMQGMYNLMKCGKDSKKNGSS